MEPPAQFFLLLALPARLTHRCSLCCLCLGLPAVHAKDKERETVSQISGTKYPEIASSLAVIEVQFNAPPDSLTCTLKWKTSSTIS